jgi:hypothetical protein
VATSFTFADVNPGGGGAGDLPAGATPMTQAGSAGLFYFLPNAPPPLLPIASNGGGFG